MSRPIGLPFPSSAGDYPERVARALGPRRLGAVGLVTVALSLGPMYSADLAGFFSPWEIVLEWLRHLAELALLAGVLTLAYALLDEALPARTPARLAILCATVLLLSSALMVLLYAYYAESFEHLPPLRRHLADTLRYGLPALFLVLLADAHRRALQADAAACAAELTRARLVKDESEQQLALLQAQIEPHFLFNVLGSVRRLYRTRPQSGADTIANLMRYLRATLPRLRSRSGTLGDEIDLARAYLDLCRVRMGERLAFAIDADAASRAAPFSPVLLLTLVENAIKHGLEPVGGGQIVVRARRAGNRLTVEVLDDGAGLATAGSAGTGVGLANIHRQLAACYDGKARLALSARTPRGVRAAISIPLPRRPATLPGEPLAA